jgi:hypothetical protein
MQTLVLLHGLLQEYVLPSPYEQDRDLDPLEGDPVPHGGPVGVGAIGTGDPVDIPRGATVEAGVGGPDQWQLIHEGVDAPARGGQPGGSLQRSTVLLMNHAVAPTQEVEPERPRAPDVLVEVVGPDGHHGRRQLRRGVGHQGPLGVAEIRAADGSEGAGEPGLVAHPGHDVVPVVDLGHHGVELAAGSERAPTAHEEGVIAAGYEDTRLQQGQGERAAVGAAHQQRPHRIVDRPVQVGGQLDAVAGGDPDVPGDRVVGRSWGKAAQRGGHPVEQALARRPALPGDVDDRAACAGHHRAPMSGAA